jgi:hypothetical protein
MALEGVGEPNMLGLIINNLFLDAFKLLDAATP